MKKILIMVIFCATVLFADDVNTTTTLNQTEIDKIEKEIITKALENKNYNEITSYGLVFLVNSVDFDGDKEKLRARGKELLQIASDNYNLSASLLLVVNYLWADPLYVHSIAHSVLKNHSKHLYFDGEYAQYANSFATIYAALVLEHFPQDKAGVELAINSLQELKDKDEHIYFYLAHLYRVQNNHQLADENLNKACLNAADLKIKSVCKTLDLGENK